MLVKRRYITVPKETSLHNHPYLEGFWFVFNEDDSREVFIKANPDFDIREACLLVEDIEPDAEVFLNNKNVYYAFLLPKVMERKPSTLFIYDKNIFEAEYKLNINTKVILPSYFLDYKEDALKRIISEAFNNDHEFFYFTKFDIENACFNMYEFQIDFQNPYKKGELLFVLHSGRGNPIDYSSNKMSVLARGKGYSTTLLRIGESVQLEEESFDTVITVDTEREYFEHLMTLPYEKIFCRGWMLTYQFSAFIAKYMRDSVIYIKDWFFSDEKDYEIIYGKESLSDFKAIDYIFKSGRTVLTHFSEEENEKIRIEFSSHTNNIHFFPEPIEESKCRSLNRIITSDIKIAMAGTVPPTSYPREFFNGYIRYEEVKNLTGLGLHMHFVLPHIFYETFRNQYLTYYDFSYEEAVNPLFKVVRGGGPDSLDDYHFGYLTHNIYLKNSRLNNYAVPSKFAFYLEAGIPIICNRSFFAIAKLVEENQIGIVFEDGNYQMLKDKIQNCDYAELQKNVAKYREAYRRSVETTFISIL